MNDKPMKGAVILGKLCAVNPLEWVDIFYQGKWQCAVRTPQVGEYGNIGKLQVTLLPKRIRKCARRKADS